MGSEPSAAAYERAGELLLQMMTRIAEDEAAEAAA